MRPAPPDTRSAPLRLFVYGTLLRGHPNHRRYCGTAVNVEPARAWGRLYDLQVGYPAMEVPESTILAQGSADPIEDAAVQRRVAATQPAMVRPKGDWDLIQGEIVSFDNPLRDLPPIDRLEGFRLGQPGLYHRVLVLARSRSKAMPAVWLYSMDHPRNGIRLFRGRWPQR
jgi:gamma-glutamylcyclotransferase (GGCT)/AIG2-like uncharacterized protein YtfP